MINRMASIVYQPPREEIERAKSLVLEIYDAIPDFECVPGCADCCGTIKFTYIERQIILEYARKNNIKIEMVSATKNCPVLDENNRCKIYPARPLICRLFGVVDHELLRCPYRQPKTLIPIDLALECLRIVDEISDELKIYGQVLDQTERRVRNLVKRLKKYKRRCQVED